jgi:hypothetical protein
MWLAADDRQMGRMAQIVVTDLPNHEAEREILCRAGELQAEAAKDGFRAIGRFVARLFARRKSGLAH